MRLFVALEPSPAFLAALCALQDSLRQAGVEGNYLKPANIHLTLAFIGERPGPEGIPLVSPQAPFSLSLGGLGVFEEADVLWAGAGASPALEGLAGSARAALDSAGVPFDPRPFVPHITLVRKPRFPEGFSPERFPVPKARMMVRESCLYLSARGEDGLSYTVIGRSAPPAERPGETEEGGGA